MRTIKKVSVTPVASNTGTIIDSMNTGDDKHTNAPSINAVTTYVGNQLEPIQTYSTTETRIGTWIDGKPLYRRIYIYSNPTGISRDTNVQIGFNDWDEVITLRGIVHAQSNKILPIPAVTYNQEDIYGIELQIVDKTSEWQPNTFYLVSRGRDTDDNRINKYIIIFEYTKTTDTV